MSNYGLSKDKLQFMAKDIGPELLPFIPKEELLSQLSIEDRFTGLTAEDLLAGLTPAERKKLEQFLRDDRK